VLYHSIHCSPHPTHPVAPAPAPARAAAAAAAAAATHLSCAVHSLTAIEASEWLKLELSIESTDCSFVAVVARRRNYGARGSIVLPAVNFLKSIKNFRGENSERRSNNSIPSHKLIAMRLHSSSSS
jgi:hypothetical protein